MAGLAAGSAQVIVNPTPPGPREFPIMAWGGSPSDAEQLRLMKEAGLNIAGFCRVEDVDKVQNAGLACFVTDPRVNRYEWTKLPPESEIRAKVKELAAQVGKNETVIGFYLRDEPHADLMPGLGKVAAILRQEMPDKLPYVNLFPSRVSTDRVGVPTYEAYARLLVDTIKQPFLSYDNYSLVGGEMIEYFYENLEIIRKIALDAKVPFWNCILANAHFNYMEPSDATFNIQVYGTLAYGGRGIQYFTYHSPQIGNYRLGAIDQFGNRTPTWDILRRINKQIHALAPTMLKLRSTGVYHYPEAPAGCKTLSESKLVASVEMFQRYVRPPIAARFMVGEFEDGQGRPYIMLVNKDLNNSFRFAVHFKGGERQVKRISPYTGQEQEFGREMDWLAPGAGVLLRVQ
ncbi:MAG: hypothetical protein KIT09_22800 [Bryobacteraceae bacterium]|nr:hypothetical protein [Bryobacteraceae bacterium]